MKRYFKFLVDFISYLTCLAVLASSSYKWGVTGDKGYLFFVVVMVVSLLLLFASKEMLLDMYREESETEL